MNGPTRRVLLIVAGFATMALVGWWVVEESRYKRPEELESKPYPQRRIELDPPAARAGLEYYGKLSLELYIGVDGKVDRVEVVSSTLPAWFLEHAVAAFSGVRWEPGTRWGRNVRAVKVVEVEIEPPPGVRNPMRPDS